jgi:protein-disulfide isomerase
MQDQNNEDPSREQDPKHQPSVDLGIPPPQRDEAHMEPPTAEGVISARARRSSRWEQLAAVLVIVVAALAVIVVTAGASNVPPKPGSAEANTTDRAITALLAGTPQSANTLGKPAAPITLEWYGDLECPFCKEFALGALPTLITRWVRTGQLKIEYLSMETATRELKVFQTQQIAALAAGMQNKMWNYIETFYHEQGEEDSGYVTEQYLHNLASQIPGLDITLWREDRHYPELAGQLATERHAASRARYRGTPTFLIGLTRGRMYKLKPGSLTNPAPYNRAIEYLIRAEGDRSL